MVLHGVDGEAGNGEDEKEDDDDDGDGDVALDHDWAGDPVGSEGMGGCGECM